ncbi:DMT family transporter [Haloechinothrix salitolerans]|uniref:DMT family transporter n=1 Tax=Haloechinothrix salitolerans TaxID=926830 RepID=A0ABW2C9S0_9PSEU
MLATVGRSRTRPKVFGVAVAFVAGFAIAIQARINGQLAVDLGDSMLAALISFGGGLTVLVLALMASRGMRVGIARVRDALNAGRLRHWYLLGGVGGAGMIFSQSLTVGVLGVATFTVGVVTGQTISGLFVDRVGLGPAGKRPISVVRLLGAALMLVAVIVTTWGGIAIAGSQAWLLVFPVLGGFAVAVQQAINGHVGVTADNALVAALVNFAVGTTVLGVSWLATAPLRDDVVEFPANPLLYVGGLVGIGFIATAALVVRWIGVLLLGLASIAGQLLASIALDVVLPAHPGGLAASTIVGAVLALVAIVVASLPGRAVALRE